MSIVEVGSSGAAATRVDVMLYPCRGWATQRKSYQRRRHGKGQRTNYGLTRRSTRSYEVHHKQRISLAAVMADAKAIRRRLLALRQQLQINAAPAAFALGGMA